MKEGCRAGFEGGAKVAVRACINDAESRSRHRDVRKM
jgi:hypothetical protein